MDRGASRRLAGLLAQPLAALTGPGYDKPVWHCAVRAAPEDRMPSDAEWAQLAVGIMDRTGLAPDGDDGGVRWVAVRHAADHVHLVVTLAAKPRLARVCGKTPRITGASPYTIRSAEPIPDRDTMSHHASRERLAPALKRS
jgi:hypothetical protein